MALLDSLAPAHAGQQERISANTPAALWALNPQKRLHSMCPQMLCHLPTAEGNVVVPGLAACAMCQN
ncbi:hypothetical protein MHYP_G00078030 [Metynnis hypsauchen]